MIFYINSCWQLLNSILYWWNMNKNPCSRVNKTQSTSNVNRFGEGLLTQKCERINKQVKRKRKKWESGMSECMRFPASWIACFPVFAASSNQSFQVNAGGSGGTPFSTQFTQLTQFAQFAQSHGPMAA